MASASRNEGAGRRRCGIPQRRPSGRKAAQVDTGVQGDGWAQAGTGFRGLDPAWGRTGSKHTAKKAAIVRRVNQIKRFLLLEDRMSIGFHWPSRFRDIETYLNDAERLRLMGGPTEIKDEFVLRDLSEAFSLARVHRGYERWNWGIPPNPTAWSNSPMFVGGSGGNGFSIRGMWPIDTEKLKRYSNQGSYHIREGVLQDLSKPVPTISLFPREKQRTSSPFMFHSDDAPSWDEEFKTERGKGCLEFFQTLADHEEQLDEGDRTSTDEKRSGFEQNISKLENETYERCMTGGLSKLVRTGTGVEKREFSGYDDSTLAERAWLRGWSRAAIQQCLNLFTSEENREVSSRWRRVILPEQVEEPKDFSFYPDRIVFPSCLALKKREKSSGIGTSAEGEVDAIDNTTLLQNEPSPWVFAYSQFAGQLNFKSAWARRDFQRSNWNNFDQICLPGNYNGPYTFDARCAYDAHWSKLGDSLMILQRNIVWQTAIYSSRERYLIHVIIRDVQAGVLGASRPSDMVPREGIDYPAGASPKDSFLLVDEDDILWLEFLAKPSSHRGMLSGIGLKIEEPFDHLMVLFDHRTQSLFNERIYLNEFYEARPDDERESHNPETLAMDPYYMPADYRRCSVPLPFLRDMVNDSDFQSPNERYQFSMEETSKYCILLAQMGRLRYNCPCHADKSRDVDLNPKNGLFPYVTDDKSDWGTVAMQAAEIFPENRVIWRHASASACRDYNKNFEAKWRKSMVDTITGDKKLPFHEEDCFRPSSHPERSLAGARDSPSWDELLDYAEAYEKQSGRVSERTFQFFRNLAFRMGRSIRHAKELDLKKGQRGNFSREDLASTMDIWREKVVSGKGLPRPRINPEVFPTIPTDPQDVILKASLGRQGGKGNPVNGLENQYTAIRKGMIDDMVSNRTMLYPGRPVVCMNGKGQALQRLERTNNIWAWANPTIRSHYAPYTREKYFEMRRWPLKYQSPANQARIRRREDESFEDQSTLTRLNRQFLVARQTQIGVGSANTLERSVVDRLQETVARAYGQLQTEREAANLELARDDLMVVLARNPEMNSSEGLSNVDQQLRESFTSGSLAFNASDSQLQSILDSSKGTSLVGRVCGWFKSPPTDQFALPPIDKPLDNLSRGRKRKIPSSFVDDNDLPAAKRQSVDNRSLRRFSSSVAPLSANWGLEESLQDLAKGIRNHSTSTSALRKAAVKSGFQHTSLSNGDVLWKQMDGNIAVIQVSGSTPGDMLKQALINRGLIRLPFALATPRRTKKPLPSPTPILPRSAADIARNTRTTAVASVLMPPKPVRVVPRVPPNRRLPPGPLLSRSRTSSVSTSSVGLSSAGMSILGSSPSLGPDQITSPAPQQNMQRLFKPGMDRALMFATTPVAEIIANIPGLTGFNQRVARGLFSYQNRFPSGFEVVPTAGGDLECGYYAIIESIQAQTNLPVPEVAQLTRLLDEAQREIVNQGFLAEDVLNYLRGDQIALALKAYGEQISPADGGPCILDLGVYVDSELANDYPFVMEQGDEQGGANYFVVWCHNDNAEEKYGDRHMNHWSGMERIEDEDEET